MKRGCGDALKTDQKTIMTRYFHDLSSYAKSSAARSLDSFLDVEVSRPVFSTLAKEVALEIDKYWLAAAYSDPGPIDVVDIFSGCGGMSAGFHAVNGFGSAYRIASAVDLNKTANRTYAANLGISALNEDVSQLPQDCGSLKQALGIDPKTSSPLILIGCAPCQGFSSHRNEAGESDRRNTLFSDFAQIAATLKPLAIVAENVPELLTNRYWPHVTKARSILDKAGYFVHLSVHNMAEFGVPQERFRALMIAMPYPFMPPRGFLRRGDFRTVRQAIAHLPTVQAGEKCAYDQMHYSAGHKQSTLETIRAVPKNGGSRPDNVGPACLARAKNRTGKAVYEDVYGRLFWDKPAITITAYARNPASGRFIHPEQDRGLTIREASLLQGFPGSYTFTGNLDEKFQQIGNAVPPIFSAFLATYLLGEILGGPIQKDHFDPGITQPVGPSFSRLIPALKSGHRC